MHRAKRLRRDRVVAKPSVEDRGGIALIRLGPANVWDAGDLGRLREAAGEVFRRGGKRLGIDLAEVGVLPSGFLHMLCVWQERGAQVYVASPRPNVREMLWFRRFAESAGNDLWRINCVPPEESWPEEETGGRRAHRPETVGRTDEETHRNRLSEEAFDRASIDL